ncbi:hypothetical protein CRUP_034455 [Coryphaenoides rupestris]|nr:hypothetical protein CRUP_034455 [Coryphaenoides rupestris]
MLAMSRPMWAELSFRSQRAVGSRKDTHRISTASLALAQPQASSSSPSSGSSPLRSAALTSASSSDPPRRHMAAVCPSQTREPYSSSWSTLPVWSVLPACLPVCLPPGPPCLPDTWSTWVHPA